jgi:hypothetical protein
VLFLLLFFFAVGVTVLLWVGTIYLTGYWYTEPTPETYWRAPAAGAALTVFLALWIFADGERVAKAPYGIPFLFSAQEDMFPEPVKQFKAVKKGVKDPIPYVRVIYVNRVGKKDYEYRERTNTGQEWRSTGVEAILIDEDGQQVRFNRVKTEEGSYVQFVDDRGWTIIDHSPGSPGRTRVSTILLTFLLNFLHLGVWFVCLWLLLRFQWAHALGLAFCLWLVTSLLIVPPIFRRAV